MSYKKDRIEKAIKEYAPTVRESEKGLSLCTSGVSGSRTNLRAHHYWYVFLKTDLEKETFESWAEGEAPSYEEALSRAEERLKRLEGSGDPKLSSIVYELLVNK